MAQNQIQFELVSPERKLVSEPLYMAVIPGVEGEMGVGLGHASFVVELQPGVVKLYAEKDDKSPRKIFITGGFADVTAANCTVLAEEAVNVNEIDRAQVESQIKMLEQELAAADTEGEKKRILRYISLANAQIQAVSRG